VKKAGTLSLGSAVVLIAAALFFSASQLPAAAQSSVQPQTVTPLPSPTGNGGTAEWMIEESTFTSGYPDGGDFALKATSSGGEIVSASLRFSLNPSSRLRIDARDRGDGSWRARWNPDQMPQWVGITYWWELRDAAGNLFQTPYEYTEYEDATRQWNRLESDDIVVFWESTLPDGLGQEILDAMESRREFFYDAWGTLLRYKPRAIIFDGYDAARDWYPFLGGGGTPGDNTRLAGFTRQDYGAFVGFYFTEADTVREMAYGTVLHEIAHLYQYQNGGSFRELWFIEGNAEYFATYRMNRILSEARAKARRGNLPPLAELDRSFRDAYDIGYAFWIWFTREYGEESHLKIMQLIAERTAGRRAFEIVSGRSFLDLETAFRDWLGAPDAALEPTPTLFMFPSPTYYPTRTPKP
jgi:hypothetical protein